MSRWMVLVVIVFLDFASEVVVSLRVTKDAWVFQWSMLAKSNIDWLSQWID